MSSLFPLECITDSVTTVGGIFYRSLYNPVAPHNAFLADVELDTTLPLLVTYFNLDTRLAPLYAAWSAIDVNFHNKVTSAGNRLDGIRVLKQDSWETLISFICSSNNHISRIGSMVRKLCEALGEKLPHPTSFSHTTIHDADSLRSYVPTLLTKSTPHLYAFPLPSRLTPESTDDLLRELGFGYRSRYVNLSAILLVEKAAEAKMTTSEWLDGLSEGRMEVGKARTALLEFIGVGRKVADCVLLFGLGFKGIVPIDTHVFQIAIRDYGFPASKATALTLILHNKVAGQLESLWGAHAGWCQQVLFFADLASTKKVSQSPSPTKLKKGEAFETPAKKRKAVVKDEEEYKEEELKEEETPIKSRTIKRVKKEKLAVAIKVEA